MDVNNKAEKFLNNSDRFFIGCQAAAGIPVSKISKDACVSRQWVYQQKDSVLNYIDSLDCPKEPIPSINIDERFIKRMVLSLSLGCHASIDGIRHPALMAHPDVHQSINIASSSTNNPEAVTASEISAGQNKEYIPENQSVKFAKDNTEIENDGYQRPGNVNLDMTRFLG